jgi:hypothetical protein
MRLETAVVCRLSGDRTGMGCQAIARLTKESRGVPSLEINLYGNRPYRKTRENALSERPTKMGLTGLQFSIQQISWFIVLRLIEKLYAAIPQ